MIAKKSKKADLEKKRFAFFQIGLIVSGAMCLAAFEYSTVESRAEEQLVFEEFQESIPIDLVEEIREEPISQPKSQPKVLQLNNDIVVTTQVVSEVKGTVESKNIIIDEGEGEMGELEIGYVEDPNAIHEFDVDVEPAFPGGEPAMAAFIQENFEMPDYMMDWEQGTVYVQFVVNKDGSIEQVSIRRGVSEALDQAAMKVVRKMPKWRAGEAAGKPVRVRFTLPIQIKR